MKHLFSALFLFLILAVSAFGQEKPLTQTEYVKMLYALQKNPAGKTELVEAVRKRGISFTLTDGLRGLTRSKGGNDEELKRTLEEAERRRQNPVTSQLPNAKEATDALEKTRQNTLKAIEEMPDFVVKQLINRSAAYAGTNNWKRLDNVAIAVSYSEKDGEQYKVLAINGSPVNAEKGNNYAGLSGTTTGGEFVEDLAKIFRPESKTEFSLNSTDVLKNTSTFIFDYQISIENNKGGGVGLKNSSTTSGNLSITAVPAGEKGKIWIDRKKFRILKIESEKTDIPATFPIKAFNSSTEYDWVEIAGEKYLLPVLSDNRFTSLDDTVLVQDRNLIRFKNYQKFGTDVIVLDDDTAPIEEEKP